jgi:perosamine synthetase
VKFQELENKFSQFVGTEGCVAVNSGTAALHLALEALQLPKNAEVIVPQYTMVATAWAVYYARLNPVFVDCDNDLLIDTEKLERSITDNTRVIMVTHVYGRVVNMDAIATLASKYNLRIIEDAAEAHGCKWNDKMVGSYDIGCFSFYRNKIICGEEGGAVVSNDLEFLEIARDMKSMSFGEKHNYMHKRIGFNYRMTNSQASLIIDSLEEIDKNIKIRKENEFLYDSLIDKKYHMPKRNVPWVYDIKVDNNKIVDQLRKQNIAARYGFKPVGTCAPFFLDAFLTKSYEMSKKIMYLPVGPEINKKDIHFIVEKLRKLQ